jgi:GNAT superfamily N-acetyltransferase
VTDAQRHGAYDLVEVDGAAVGMGAVQRCAEGVAEVKRMYVRPGQRGRRLGPTLLARLVEDARSLGYEHVRLETGAFMASAHRTYEAAGFVDEDAPGRVQRDDLR